MGVHWILCLIALGGIDFPDITKEVAAATKDLQALDIDRGMPIQSLYSYFYHNIKTYIVITINKAQSVKCFSINVSKIHKH